MRSVIGQCAGSGPNSTEDDPNQVPLAWPTTSRASFHRSQPHVHRIMLPRPHRVHMAASPQERSAFHPDRPHLAVAPQPLRQPLQSSIPPVVIRDSLARVTPDRNCRRPCLLRPEESQLTNPGNIHGCPERGEVGREWPDVLRGPRFQPRRLCGDAASVFGLTEDPFAQGRNQHTIIVDP